jgi:hypothetical protein
MTNVKKIDLQCSCGAMGGHLEVHSSKMSFHVHCLCRDCQAYAVHLGNEEKILDQFGGSELFQTYPSYLKITQGAEHLACLRLKEDGLMRWHTSCCNMPIANTMASPKVPFIGVSVKLMKFASDQEKQEVLGPVVMKAFGRSARGQKPEDVHDTFPRSFMPKILKFMALGFLGRRNNPSPFFKEGKPTVKPLVLA